MDVCVVGGGIAGLVAAYELSKGGANVTLLEKAMRLGGLAGSFALESGQEIEKYYHFLCRGDHDYFAMLEELGLSQDLHWVTTDMGLFYNGALHSLGDPLSLLTFSHLTWQDKWRFALTALRAKVRAMSDWKDLEDLSARDWLIDNYGAHTYDVLYRPLLEMKFGQYAPRISAAWMWARLHRLGNSRTRGQKEYLGYLEGGSQVYIDALEGALRKRSVNIRTQAAVERIEVSHGTVTGVWCDGEMLPFDVVISTVPIPHTQSLFADLEGPYFENLRALPYIGVMVMLLRLKKKFSPYYWMNISDPEIPIVGIIEYTNLNPYPELNGETIMYIPQYLVHTDPLYTTSDLALFEAYCGYLNRINPEFDPTWVQEYRVHRDRFAQPICEVGFSGHVPAIQTPLDNLLLTDSYQLHPHDRAITFSTGLGLDAARLALSKEPIMHSNRKVETSPAV